MKKCRKNTLKSSSGITLIALVITIVVLLILAGISIMMLTGENGIIKQATKSKEETIIGQEKEQVEMAYVSAAINKLGENVTSKELQTELNNLVGQNKTNVSGSTILKVYFNDTEHEYKVKNGKVTKYEKMEPTAVYAKLYTDGTLILSSYDYTDETKVISEDYRDISGLEYYWDGNKPEVLGNPPGWIPTALYRGEVNESITNIIIFDKIAPTNMLAWFAGLPNLTSLDLDNIDTSNVTSMSMLFAYCDNILPNLNLSKLDTRAVTDMSFMFFNCCSLNSLDLSGFDSSNVTSMDSMFYQCSSLTSLDLSGFDTSKVTIMKRMFFKCSSLTSLDLSGFDTSKVTNMYDMFSNCSSLNTIYASSKWSNESVTLSNSMFGNCTNLKGAISYDSSKKDVTYANYDTGYFTYKEAP